PGAGGHYDNAADPEMEAQIAQWQSAYSKDNSTASHPTGRPTYATNPSAAGGSNGAATSANAAPLGGRDVSSAVNADTGVATVVGGKDGKQATVVRSGGGTQWTDSSLLDDGRESPQSLLAVAVCAEGAGGARQADDEE
ncbi:hypothetical protein V491_02514, partial [Pseudogymnoascus sp. VKM F-3775]